MKNTFLFLVAFLLSLNSYSQYVVTRTDTIFGKVITGEFILGKLVLKLFAIRQTHHFFMSN
jgi:hypothetical protein